MEIYALDKSLTRIDLIENYEAFVWTIRYSEAGDFVLKIPEASFPYDSLRIGNYLEKDNSNRLMRIQKIRKTVNDEGVGIVECSGGSMETVLRDRVVTPNPSSDYWTLTGGVGYVATELVRRICIAGTELSNLDKIPNLTYTEQSASQISRTVKLESKDLFSAVKELCDEDDLGFRIFFIRNSKSFDFKVYRGFDRTIGQTVNDPVVFSESLDNLVRSELLSVNSDQKNVAYVRSGNTTRIVSKSNPSGLDRKVLLVDANDIQDPTNNKLDARGYLELAKHKSIRLFTGEVSDTDTYTYEVDYEIGDIVTTIDTSGRTGKSIISEFVTTYDNDGYRAYPTFTALD